MRCKKFLSLLMTLTLSLSVYVPSFAAGSDSSVLTRGEFVCGLFALKGGAGSSAVQEHFKDIPLESDLAPAVSWAVSKGIVNGYGDGRFVPGDPVTREQMAAMLYRCAQAEGQGFTGTWSFEMDYPDANQISGWADEAMHWAVMKGILIGTEIGLEPKATATDDQLSIVLDRWNNTMLTEDTTSSIDYLALVNKTNALPEGWEEALKTVTTTNSVGDEVEVEAKAYEAYLQLKDDLEKNDGIYLELDSARRSVAAQQDIMDRFIEKYGADYAAKTVAQPGYSEHHTGLALDLYFKLKNEDGTFTDVYYNEDMVQYPQVWEKIHAKLAKYGFILRYLEGREHITGYGYEPWHIRYLDDAKVAEEITQKDLTLEEYLSGKKAPEVSIDYGNSTLYSREELDEAIVQIKCKFAGFGSELHSISYAGDDVNTAENIAWLNSLDEGKNYTQICEFRCDFLSGDNGVLNPYEEYKDYQWWLARTEDGGWQLLTWGY